MDYFGKSMAFVDMCMGDCSIDHKHQSPFEVKATTGDRHWGGEDFDSRIVGISMRDMVRMRHADVVLIRPGDDRSWLALRGYRLNVLVASCAF